MGIEQNSARLLLYAKRQGASFESTAMLGRQQILMSEWQLQRSFRMFGDEISNSEIKDDVFRDKNRYAEPLFYRLGAKVVDSFDNSDFEQATHLHDFNKPVPDVFKNRYTALFDGGCIEHVFNFPVAIKNCMEMLEIGGHYISSTPANNLFGHGFYQFSPELLYRVFSKENGFEVTAMIAAEDFKRPKWYAVKDPDIVRSRVILSNSMPVYLHLIAKKIADVPIFAKTPQQSDYVARWNAGTETNPNGSSEKASLSERLKDKLPTSLRFGLLRLYQRLQYGFNKRHFVRFDPISGTYPKE